jgi:hypothetical protein
MPGRLLGNAFFSSFFLLFFFFFFFGMIVEGNDQVMYIYIIDFA